MNRKGGDNMILMFMLCITAGAGYLLARKRLHKGLQQPQHWNLPKESDPQLAKLLDWLSGQKLRPIWTQDSIREFCTREDFVLLTKGDCTKVQIFFEDGILASVWSDKAARRFLHTGGFTHNAFVDDPQRARRVQAQTYHSMQPGSLKERKRACQKPETIREDRKTLISTAQTILPAFSEPEIIKEGTQTELRNGRLYVKPDYEGIAREWIGKHNPDLEMALCQPSAWLDKEQAALPEEGAWQSIGENLMKDKLIASYQIGKQGIEICRSS